MNGFPPYIAICGAPGAGKTTVQNILEEEFGCTGVDSVLLKETAVILYGLTREQVSTQEGKKEEVEIMGRKWIVRDLLGGLGIMLRQMHGEDFMSERTVADARAAGVTGPLILGSMRRDSAGYFRRNGGICVEVVRDGCEVENDYDRYEKSLVDIVLLNDGSPDNLRRKTRLLAQSLMTGAPPLQGTSF